MSRDLLLFGAVFLACAVEGVEAVTIVLAAGITRDWRSTWIGVAGALAVLAVIVAILGPALTTLPIGALRLIVGGLLLTFGLQWLRKAILRAGGLKALHDEDAIYAREVQELRAAGSTGRRSTPTRSPSASRACCSRGWRSRSSSSRSAATRTTCRSP